MQGLGSDIIEIERIRASIEKHGSHFLQRLFSQEEQNYCLQFQDSIPHFAGRFAAKEAVAKALGTGFGAELAWLDFEILNNGQGKPMVLFNEASCRRFSNPRVQITISHCIHYAMAVAVWL